MKKIPHEIIDFVIKNKAFPEDMLKEKTAIIMTQEWCPQWKAMKKWVTGIKDVAIYVHVYDDTSEFKEFKEKNWNDKIPYVRYYKDGKFICDSNYLSKEEFLKRFE